jgi:hypothetical protein
MKKLATQLDEFVANLLNSDHELLVLAESNPEVLDLVSTGLVRAATVMKEIRDQLPQTSILTVKALEEMAVVAEEFDRSGDPLLEKQASVMDEILLTIGANKTEVDALKKSQEAKIEKLKRAEKEEDKKTDDLYTKAKKEHDKDNRVEEAKKMIADKVKSYRPLEASLQSRSCPDHPGVGMTRVGDGVFQCSMDNKMYNYDAGYQLYNGDSVPGGDVANQTRSFGDYMNESISFDTRESRLNDN